MPSQRQERVAERLREDLSHIIQRELADPRLAVMVSVTDVSVSPDLQQARVFVSVYGSDDERQQAMDALASATGHIRGLLGRTAQLRYTPELEFELDTSFERADRIERLLNELKSEQSGEAQAGHDPEDRGADPEPR